MVEQKTSFSHVFSLKEPLSSLKYKCDIVFSVFKKEVHNVYSEEINKIALSSNDNKRCKLLIEIHYIHMVLVMQKYAKQSSENC